MKNFKPLALGAAVTIALSRGGWGLPPVGPRKVYRDKPVKQCAHCGNDHQHNNRFCSAECCRAYTAGSK